MTKRSRYRLFFIALGITGFFLLGAIGVVTGFTSSSQPHEDLLYGATFSKKYAEELGLPWKEVYNAMIDELEIKNVRLSAYWDELEPVQGEYDWSWLDYQIRQIEAAEGDVVLAVGRRLPRWPECHVPEWAAELPEEEQQALVLGVIERVVNRYKDRDVIIAWQVENEPLLNAFGECPPADKPFFEEEVNLVKSLDDRPIVVTESGELSTWQRTTQFGDILGTSLYRIVWNPLYGYTRYPFTPGFYITKARFLPENIQDVWISELQLEPWADRPIMELSNREMFRSMDLERFVTTLDFAERTGFERIYVWGVEWWYYMKEVREIPDYWETIKVYTQR